MKKIDTFYMSDEEIEELKRKKVFNKKMADAAKFGLVGAALFITGIIFRDNFAVNWTQEAITQLEVISSLVGGTGMIIGGMKFAAALHEPLTEKEAEEFKQKDAEEKGGGVPRL